MSETPSCATMEPSMYSTIECTIDSGWTTMSMRRGSTPKSQRASLTSSPLFMRVAESIVILSPIDQFGCLSARAGVTSRSSGAGTVRSGPLDAAHEQLAREHERLLVREADRLAGLDGGRGRAEPRRAGDRGEHEVHVRVGRREDRSGVAADHLDAGGDEPAQLARGGLVRDRDEARVEAAHLLGEPGDVLAGGERDDLEPLGEGRDDVQRLDADGAGRAEDGDALHGRISSTRRPMPPLGPPLRQQPRQVLRADVDPRGDEEEGVDPVEE